MALLWTRQTTDCHYEVRSAGRSVRLYSNSVFHSQWNPNRVFSDAIWDLLGLAAIPLVDGIESRQPLRVLVLGVGGGAVIRQLLALFATNGAPIDESIGQPKELVIKGVDLDPQHLAIARRWFGLAKFPNVDLIAADAVDWVASYQGPSFDLVIDDLFGHGDVEVTRSVAFDKTWARELFPLVANNGALVVNNGDHPEFKAACRQLLVPKQDVSVGGAGVGSVSLMGIQLTHPRYDNRILVAFRNADTWAANWRRHWLKCIEEGFKQAGLPKAQCRLARSYIKRAKQVYGD